LISHEGVVPPLDAQDYTQEQRRKMGDFTGVIGQESGVRIPVGWRMPFVAIQPNQHAGKRRGFGGTSAAPKRE
jgi:hypothetical protein